MKKLILAGCLMGMTGLNALAGGWGFSIAVGGPVYCPPPVYVAPAPVYVAPPPVYMPTPPVVVHPAPVVVTHPVYVAPPPPMVVHRPVYVPRPVVCAPMVHFSFGGHWRHHHR